MTTIYGILGYSFLKKNLFNNYVLILSDMHDKMKYCNKPFINISDWLSSKLDSSDILLEEVNNNNDSKLHSLWDSSIHTKQLKELFLNNSEIIHAIDIRPSLIPFSWEILENDIIENNIINISLKEYLQIIDSFLINNKINLSNQKIINHLNLIKKEYNKFKFKLIKYNYYDRKIYNIYKNNINILDSINTILDNIMEWFTIYKLYKSKKNVIIHTGLYHSEKILYLLLNLYKYKLVSQDGINKISQVENKINQVENNSECILIPKIIDNIL